jgi:hypothetical protein
MSHRAERALLRQLLQSVEARDDNVTAENEKSTAAYDKASDGWSSSSRNARAKSS